MLGKDIPDTHGRWPSIYSILGIEVGNGKHRPCPMCGGEDRFRFDNNRGMGNWICNNCGAGDGWSLIQNVRGWTFPEAIKNVRELLGDTKVAEVKKKEPNIEYMNQLYRESRPMYDDQQYSPVGLYLQKRGLHIYPDPLRYHQGVWEPETKTNHPAMLATFSTDTGVASTIQITYLTKMGDKAPVKVVKRSMTPKYPMKGGAVRLFPVGRVLGVAEGIETAIAAHEGWGIPVWATLSANLLEAFCVPIEVESLIIFGDNDKNFTGQAAAYALAKKLCSKCQISVEIPAVPGTDWADELVNPGGSVPYSE